MAGKTAILSVRIVSDADKAAAGFAKTESRAARFGSTMRKMAVPAAIAGAAVFKFARSAGRAASEAEQSAGAAAAVFKSSYDKISAYARKSATSVGLSSAAYEQMAAVIGSQLKNMGVPMDKVAGKTNKLITRGADLAAMLGGTTKQAVEALSSMLRGELDPIEQYGVSIKQAAIKSKMAEMGLDGLTGAAKKNAKLQATMALLTEQTASATGRFAAEATSAAGAQQIANARWADAQAKLGKVLLPLMVKFAGVLSSVAQWVSKNSGAVTALAAILAGLAAAVLAINGAMMAFKAAAAVATAAQWLWNAALTANPIGIIVVAVAAFIGALILAYKKVDWFRAFVDAVFKAIKTVIGAVAKWFKDTWNKAIKYIGPVLDELGQIAHDVFKAIADFVKKYLLAVKAVWSAVWNFAVDLVGAVARGVKRYIMAVKLVITTVARVIRAGWSAAWNFVARIVRSVTGGIRRGLNAARSVIDRVASVVRSVLAGAFDIALSAFNGIKSGIVGGFQTIISWVRSAADWVRSLFSMAVPGWVSQVGSFLGFGGTMATPALVAGAAGVPAGIGGPSLPLSPARFAANAGSTDGPTIVNVTVNGALDPVAVGDQIKRLLTGTLRRDGVIVNGGTPW